MGTSFLIIEKLFFEDAPLSTNSITSNSFAKQALTIFWHTTKSLLKKSGSSGLFFSLFKNLGSFGVTFFKNLRFIYFYVELIYFFKIGM